MGDDFYYRLLLLEEQHEGYRLAAYQDSKGIWTVGIGHNLQAHGLPWVQCVDPSTYDWSATTITPQQAEDLFRVDIKGALADCAALPYWDALNDSQKLAIADMMFNMGQPTFATFTTFNRLMLAGTYDAAANDLAGTLWARQVKSRASDVIGLLQATA